MKEKIIECISAPVITKDTFEGMPFSYPTQIFSEIYEFHCGAAEEKKN